MVIRFGYQTECLQNVCAAAALPIGIHMEKMLDQLRKARPLAEAVHDALAGGRPIAGVTAQIPWTARPLEGPNHASRGGRGESSATTGEAVGSGGAAIEATARRDGGSYLLSGVKWHVTSFNTADYAFFQGKLDGGRHHGEHALFLVDLPSPGGRVVRVLVVGPLAGGGVRSQAGVGSERTPWPAPPRALYVRGGS